MKKLLSLYIILIGISVSAQQSANRFEQSEYEYAAPVQEGEDNKGPEEPAATPPNPGGTVPIDGYLPLLMVAAVGLIGYKVYRRKSVV